MKRKLRNEKSRIHKHKNMDIDSSFTLDQWVETLEYFDNSCAYCGKTVELTQDHFIPVSKGGKYIKGNVIPACLFCNVDKGTKTDSEFVRWYSRQLFYSKSRLTKLSKFLKDHSTARSQI